MSNPLKWYGGKTYLAKKIIERFPPHIHYVEPYFGGGAVLFAKPKEWIEGISEVVNDRYGGLMNFWAVLRCPEKFQQFHEIVSQIPFSQTEYQRAIELQEALAYVQWPLNLDYPHVGAAVAFFVQHRQSRMGMGKEFMTLSKNRTRRGMNENVSQWWSAVEGLPDAAERLGRVVTLCDDAIAVIKREDTVNTFFYLDPPYLHETRTEKKGYLFEMSREDHTQLLKTLSQINGQFLLSGYPSRLYDQAAERFGWHCDEIKIDNKASSKKIKEIKTECLWRNYGLPDMDLH